MLTQLLSTTVYGLKALDIETSPQVYAVLNVPVFSKGPGQGLESLLRRFSSTFDGDAPQSRLNVTEAAAQQHGSQARQSTT